MTASIRFTSNCAGLLLVPIVCAADFTWTGTFDPRADEWSNPNHWSGPSGQYPESRSDSALITGTTTSDPELDINVLIGAVTIRGGAVLDTNGFQYSVFNNGGLSGDTIIEGAGSMLRIFNDPSNPNFAGSGIIVDDGGTLLLETTGLPVDLAARKLDINAGGLVEGAGNLTQLGRTGVVSNDGTLRVTGGVLTMQPWDTDDVFDWDGTSGDGRIEVMIGSELRIEMPVETSFDGRIYLSSGSVLDVQSAWTLELLLFTDYGATPCSIRGGPLSVAGQINSNNSLRIGAETTVLPGGEIIIQTYDSITFEAPVTVSEGGVIYGTASDFVFDAPAVIAAGDGLVANGFGDSRSCVICNSDVSIGTGPGSGRYDMDGNNGSTAIEIGSNHALTIDVDGVDLPDDRFDGLIKLAGTLDVTVADGEWEMAGRLEAAGANDLVIRGSRMRVTGEMDTRFQDLEIESSVIFDAGSVFTMGGGFIHDDIVTSGPLTRFSGGTLLDGASAELLSPIVEVTASSVVESLLYLTIGDDTTLNIQAPFLVESRFMRGEEVKNGPDPVRATVNITAPGYLELIDPDLIGDAVTTFEGPLRLNGSGGSALLRGTKVFRVEGDMIVDDIVGLQAPIEFAGPVTFNLFAEMHLLGGTPESPNLVEPGASFVTPVFLGTARVVVFDETRIMNGALLGGPDGFDGPSAVFAEVRDGGVLCIEPGGDAGRSLLNAGTVKVGDPGEPIGSAACQDYVQQASGRLLIRVGPGSSDSVIGQASTPFTTKTAFLDGDLVVTLEPGVEPGDGDEYTIVAFDERVGEFSTVTGPSNMELIYDPDGVRIRFTDPACNPADISEPFGILDLADIGVFVNGFTMMDPIADLNDDGIYDLGDLGLFVSAFLAGCP